VDSSNPLDFTGHPSLSLGSGSLVTYSGALTPGASGYVLGGGGGSGAFGPSELTVTSLLAGNNALTVNGNLTLPNANTFTGAVTLNAGTTRIINNDALGNPANVVTLNGGTLQLATVTSSAGGEYFQLGNVVGGGARTIVVGAGGGTIDVPALASGYSGAAIVGPNALTGSGTLTKSGLGFLFVVEPQDFAGNLVIGPNGNQFDIRGMGAMNNIASVTINQSSYLNVLNQARLMSRQYPGGEQGAAYANDNRFNDSATILLQGGRLMYQARNATLSGTSSREIFGPTTVGVGQSEIYSERQGGGGSDLVITNLIHNYGGGTVRFTASNTIGQGGDNGRIILNAINGVATPANPTAIFVGGWAVVGSGDFAAYYNPTSIGQAGGVGNYGGTGFPAYTALSTTTAPGGGGWASGNIGSAAGDCNLGTPGAAQNFVVGALRLAGAATRNIAFLNTTNLDTLYVESGGILSDNNNNARNIGNQAVGSRLTAGPVGVSGNYELFLHNNQNTMTIFSNIIDNPAGGMVRLVKDLDATVVLNPTVIRSSTTTSGSATVNLAGGATTGNLQVGMPISGTGIPAGATIQSITNPTQFVMNMNATASGTNNLTYYYTNTYSGGTLHERGTLEAQTAGSLGSGFVTVKNARLNLNVAGTTSGTGTFGGFQATDNGEIYLNNANWGVGGGNILNTINIGDRFIIEPGSVIIGPNARNANQGLNALTRVYGAPAAAGEIQLMPDAIVGHQSFSNDPNNGLGVQTIKNLGTAADLYYGLSGDCNPGVYSSVVIGAGTPWKGISTDRNSRSWFQGTIIANSDFYLQGLLRDNGLATLNMGGGGNNSWAIVNNAGKPINAFVVGAVSLNDDVSPSMPTDLTFVVTPGAILSPNYSNSLGSPSMYPGTGYASVRVQAGGTLDPGNFVHIGFAANQPYNVAYPVPGPLNGGLVTIEPGGRILINDPSGIGSGQAGNITMKTDSIMHLGTANAFFGMDPITHMINTGQFVYEPGTIIRMDTSNVYKMSQFVSGEPNGDRVVYEIYNGDRNLTNIINPFILPAPGSVLIAPENITIANGGMITNDSNDRTLQEGRGRLILGDGAVLAGTNQTLLNIQEGMDVAAGATVNIGTTRWIDGNPKLGTVRLTGPNSNTAGAGVTFNVVDGAELIFQTTNVFPDTAALNLPAAVTYWPPVGNLPPGPNQAIPGNGSTLWIEVGTGTTNAEVIGPLTGNGGVFGAGYLAPGWGATSDFTFAGNFKFANNQNAGLVKLGPTKMTLTNWSDSSADVQIVQGELALAGAGTTNFTNVRVGKTGTLTLDNSGTAMNDRLRYGGTLRNIAGQGGTINLIGNAVTPVTETIGTLYTGGSPAGSLSYLNVTPGAAATTFLATTIESYTSGGRQTTWVLRSPTLGNLPGTYDASNAYTNNPGNLTNGLIRATTPNLWGSGGIVGSGMGIAGSAGTPVASTRPDLLGTTDPTGQGVGFVTQDVSNQATVGFRLLTAAEYAPAFLDNMNTNLNIRLTGTATTSGDTRFQTLTMTPGSTLNITGTLPYNLTPSRVHLNSPGIFVEPGGTATINGTWLQALGGSSLYLHAQGNLNLNATAFSDTGIVKTGPGTLTFGPGAASAWRGTFTIDDGTVTLGPNDSFYVTRGQWTFRGQNLHLNGGTLDLGGNSQIINALNSANWLPYGAAAGGTITSAAPVTFAVQGGGTFSGSFAGAVSLDKLSNNTLTLTGNSPTTGPLLVRQGALVLRDEALFANTPQVDINYATLQLENGYLAAYNDRINPAATMNMRGGSLNIVGRAGQLAQQNLATVNLLQGQNVFNSNAGGSGANEVIITDLNRSPGAFVTFQQNYGFIGTPGNDTTAIRDFITNINGSPLTLTNNILPAWMIVNGDHFATYSPATGISYLSNTADGYNNYDSGDVTQALPWQNVNDGANRTIRVSRTVNSIRNAPNAANTFTLSPGVTLTVASGGILTNNNNVFTYTGGTITSGTNELDVWVNQNNTVFSSVIADGPAGSVSLVKGGGGTLTLQANNTYTGTTYVDAGTLTLNRTGANGTTDVAVPGNLVIHNAAVSESLPSQIRATADVTLYGGGVLNMRDAVVTETLNSLTLINNGGGTTNNVPIVSRASQRATAVLNLTAPAAILAISDNVTSTPTISQNLGVVNFTRVGGPQTIDVQGSSPLGLVFNAAIGTVPTGISEGGLIKTGAGVLHLGGNLASTFGSPAVLTDVFNIQQGIVRVDTTAAAAASGRLGSNLANTVVQSGAGIVARASNANPIFGSIRLKAGSFLGVSEGDSTFGAATTSIPSQSLLNVAGDATIYVADYWLQQTHGYTINLNSKLTGSGNINLIGPQITGAVGTLRLGNNITDDPAAGGITPGANDYSGTITLNPNTVLLAQATATAVTGNELGNATINLAGGTLALRDNNSVNYGNNVILSANSFINANNAGANTGNTITLGTLTVPSGSPALTTTFTGASYWTVNNSYQLAFASLDGAGTFVKGGHQVVKINSLASGFSDNIEVAGPQGIYVQPSAGLSFPYGASLQNFTVNGIHHVDASTSLAVNGTLRIGDNAGQVVNGTYGVTSGSVTGAMSIPSTATVAANTLDNRGIIGSTGGNATITANTIIGRGVYQTYGQPLTVIGSLADGSSPTLLKVAGNNVVTLQPSGPGTSTGGTEVQSGTLRVAPTAAVTNPLGTGDVQVLAYAPPTVSAATSATLQFNAAAGTIVQNSDIVNSGLVQVTAGSVTIGGTIAGPGAGAYVPGLLESLGGTWNAATPQSTGGFGIKLEPRMGNYNVVTQNPITGWGDNHTWVYSGQFYDADGYFSFIENIDDNAYILIDGVPRLSNAGSAVTSTASTAGQRDNTTYSNSNAVGGTLNFGMGPNGDGWHTIEIRFNNGYGGAGPWAAYGPNGFANNFGFGLNTDGTRALDGALYTRPIDPGNASLFRTPIVAKGNVQVDVGATLNANAITLTNELRLAAGAPGGAFGIAAAGPSDVDNLTVTGSSGSANLTAVPGAPLTINTALSIPSGTTLNASVPAGITIAGNASGAGTLNLANTNVTFDSTAPQTFSTVNITGTGNLIKEGTSTLGLAGNNSYSGATLINQGTLKLGYAMPAGAALWLDASDLSTITKDGSGYVSQWNDKSGNNRNATQGTAAMQPLSLTNPLVNGLYVMRFDGSDDIMSVDLSFLAPNSRYTMFIVEGRLGTKSENYILGTDPGATNQGLYVGYRNDTTWTLAQYANDLDTGGLPGYTTQLFRLWTNELDSVGHYIFLDGVQRASNTNTTGMTTANSGVVGSGFGGRRYIGDLAEVLIYNAGLSAADRQIVEAYLMAKWFGGGINPIPDTSPVTVLLNAILDLNNNNETIGSLAGAGNVILGSGTLTTGGNNNSTTYSGQISGTGGLVKEGSGAFTMTGASTYTGPTTVNNGSLYIDGSITSNVTANGGRIGGSGVINGTVNVGNARIGAGTNASTAILTMGDLTMTTNSILEAALAGLTAGSGYDQLSVQGLVNLAGTIDLGLFFLPHADDLFFIIVNDGADPVNGIFNGLPQDSKFIVGSGLEIQVTYVGDYATYSWYGGNDVALRLVPEPATITVLGLGAIGLLLRRRKAQQGRTR